MNASKENARQARINFTAILKHVPKAAAETQVSGAIAKMHEFLDAAERKLPSEKAFKDDAKRRATAKK